MSKKVGLISILILLIAVVFVGCDKFSGIEQVGDIPDGSVCITGTIIEKRDSSILLNNDAEDITSWADLYSVNLNESSFWNENGDKIASEELCAGMVVDVYYDGTIKECYPALIGASKVVIKENPGDLIHMYLEVIRQMYEEDPGLNDSIQTVALDLSGITNLTESQKCALVYLLECDFFDMNYEIRMSSMNELQEEGEIKDLYYENGILFILSNFSAESDNFGFKVQKWRSGLGAIGYDNCSAKRVDGEWEYELKGAWIS